MPDYVAWKHRASHFLQGIFFFATHTLLLQPGTQHMLLFSTLTVGIALCEGQEGNSCNCSVACLHRNLLVSVTHQPDRVPERVPLLSGLGRSRCFCVHACSGYAHLENERTKNKIQQNFEKNPHNFN